MAVEDEEGGGEPAAGEGAAGEEGEDGDEWGEKQLAVADGGESSMDTGPSICRPTRPFATLNAAGQSRVTLSPR